MGVSNEGYRRPDFPQCGRCCARFLLDGNDAAARQRAQMAAPPAAQQAPQQALGQLPAEALASAAAAGPQRTNLVAELRELAHLHREGLLSLAEFESAKQRFLGSC